MRRAAAADREGRLDDAAAARRAAAFEYEAAARDDPTCAAAHGNLARTLLARAEDERRTAPRADGSPRARPLRRTDQVDTAVTLLQSIWADKIAPSAPVAYAKSALALTPEKLEELKATREAYFAKIEQTLALLRAKAVALPEKLTGAVTAAIAEARAQMDNAQLFEKVKSAYETVLKYPAVVAMLERAAPAAAKAADVAAPYVAKAAAFAEPYVAAVKTKVMPSKPVEQLD